jgi:hypothetical protein
MVGVPGEEVVPTDFVNMIVETIEFDPPESAAGKAIQFNHAYAIYTDNVGVGGSSNTRLWVDTPDGADVIIGPRAGGSSIANLRLRTTATIGSAANMFIDSTTYKVSRSTSSRKYKTDIEPIEIDEEAVLAMRPVRFRGRSEVADRARYEARLDAGEAVPDDEVIPEPREHVGLIAEEVHELGLTGFVVYHEGEPDALMYDRMIVGAVQVLRRQAGRIATLEETVSRLVEQVDELRDIEQQRKG